MASPLTSLAGIVSSGVQNLESAYKAKGLSFPSLDEPLAPTPLDDDPDLAAQTRLIVGAAYQIIATVRPPLETIQDYAPSMYLSATLGFAEEADLADAIKEGGAQGLHVNDISKKTGVDAVMLARILRYLATRHVFKEVAPDVFANNRISSSFLKAKPYKDLNKDILTKWEDAPTAAFIGHVTDEGLQGAATIPNYLQNPPKEFDSPWNYAARTDKKLWSWYEEPDNVWRYHRFTSAMKGGADRFPQNIFTDGYDWKSLAPDSLVVDVGGSVGKVTLILYNSFPHLKYIVQDLPNVVDDAKKFWAEAAPKAITDGRVQLVPQDFFQPQPTKPAIYILRLVLHDWPDAANIKILKSLRASASPSTRLVVFDGVQPHVCHVPIPGGPPAPPAPILGNLGAGLGSFLTMLDLQMFTLMNGQERTFEQFIALGAQTGWKFEGAKPGPLTAFTFSPA